MENGLRNSKMNAKLSVTWLVRVVDKDVGLKVEATRMLPRNRLMKTSPQHLSHTVNWFMLGIIFIFWPFRFNSNLFLPVFYQVVVLFLCFLNLASLDPLSNPPFKLLSPFTFILSFP